MSKLKSHEIRAAKLLTRLHMIQPIAHRRRKLTFALDRAITKGWGWQENILGIGVSTKITKNRRTKLACITIFVRKKRAEHRILKSELIPRELFLPSIGRAVLTDLVEMKAPIVAHSLGQVRPIQPGVDIANEHGAGGTLGLLVTKDGEDGILAMSCSHVIALAGLGNPGIDRVEQPFDSVADPSINAVGLLTQSFSSLRAGGFKNSEDFALAKLSVVPNPAQLDTGVIVKTVAPEDAQQYEVGRPTFLNGFITKNAHGRVAAYQSTWKIDAVPGIGTVTFTDVVAYRTRCAKGDSGAVVLDDGTNQAIGLHIAGSTTDNIGLFMPLGPVFAKYDLHLVTE